MPLDVVADICNECEADEKKLREKYADLFKYVDIVNGCVVSVGNHPCGMVVSPHSIDDKMGLFTTTTDDVPISQINMKEVDLQNYVKLDLLKLDTIELINDTCKLAGIERLTPDNVDITDKVVWDSIRDDTAGIFQWSGSTGDRYIKQLMSEENIEKFKAINPNVDYMTLLSIGNGAIRPAGASYRDDLANGVIRKSGCDAIDEFMKSTFGYLVFQEQIIQFLHQYCGYTMGQADVVRRHFAKKTGTDKDIPQIKEGFAKTMAEKYDMSREKSDEVIAAFIQVIIDASNYLFSLNHSQPYSYEGYVSGWLRYYYPHEFLATALNINIGKVSNTEELMAYTKKVGIKIGDPLFGYSRADYFCDKQSNTIYKGIASIKHMNAQVAEELYSLKDGDYRNFIDLLYAMENTSIDSRQLDILVKIGYFDKFGAPNALLDGIEMYNKYGKCKTIKVSKLTDKEFDIAWKCAGKTTDKTLSKIDNKRLVLSMLRANKITPTTIVDRIIYQIQYLGYTSLNDPSYDHTIWIVSNVETTSYGTTRLSVYNVAFGVTKTYKVDKKWYSAHKCDVGDVIQAVLYDKPKWTKDANGQFIKTGEKETVIKCYEIMNKKEKDNNE